MAKDYKYRVKQNSRKAKKTGVTWWKWLLIFALISLFVIFLNFIGQSGGKVKPKQPSKIVSTAKKTVNPKNSPAKHQNKKSAEPYFNFYTILAETEVIVADYEIKTRSREEKFGKTKTSKYLLQVGSFRKFSEADKLRAKLALMGIESKVEKTNIGNVLWNRVRIGPYSRSSSISAIKKRLKKNGIDVVVTEAK